MGPLGLGSPRLRSRGLAPPGPAALRVATTAFVLPGWFVFGSRPVPWVDALGFVFPPARAGFGSFTVGVQRSTPGCWLRRAPVFRRCRPRRREVLPSSRMTPLERMPRSQTPVVSRPLALTRTGLLPSRHWIPSAFSPVARTYRLTTTIHFSALNSAACVLASPLLRTPPLGDRTSVRLPARWLAFGRVGSIGTRRRTHWGWSPAGRGWAREDSGDLVGTGRQRSKPQAVRPPGARAAWLAIVPGSFYLANGTSLWNEEKRFGASAPPAHPQKTGAVAFHQERPGSRLQLAWTAGG